MSKESWSGKLSKTGDLHLTSKLHDIHKFAKKEKMRFANLFASMFHSKKKSTSCMPWKRSSKKKIHTQVKDGDTNCPRTSRSSPVGSNDSFQKDGDHLRLHSPYGSPPKNGLDKALSESVLSLSSGGSDSVHGHMKSTVRDASKVNLSNAVSSSSQGSGHDEGDALGDVFIWGEGTGDAVLGGGAHIVGSGFGLKMDSLLPKALESTAVLDIQNIACGRQHAALVTKQGELFSWGEGSRGRLGHGVDCDVLHPKLVDALSSINIELVACGEYHTCAVTVSGDLYTWGDGTSLARENEASQWVPKRVNVNGLLEGIHVSSISCGPWHTAVVTSSGQLFTFGDGIFGVLGHGDRISLSMPREVESLKGLRTVQAACGVWHTAAVVEVTVGDSKSGKLFTWGDGDKGILGHGDKEAKLVPTCVAALVEPSFCQVACGQSMTVALTTSGHVYAMGSPVYGQLGNPHADGKLPSRVDGRLSESFVEEIACGAYHVAVLTSKTEVYTWGKGENGRLGHGDTNDRNSPSLVEALKDKQVKSIACGTNFTAAFCLHKWVSGNDQSTCSRCHHPFNFIRKRHNCYNCGLVICHSCSSKKALKASMAPNPNKPYRVCDNCFNKLRKTIKTDASSHSSISRRGVTSHRWTGRYEAGTHLWDNSCKKEGQSRKGRQGAYDMECETAKEVSKSLTVQVETLVQLQEVELERTTKQLLSIVPETRLQLLSNASGVFSPGVLTALVSSGAGKTTSMDVLAGRKTGGYIEGEIKISGYPKEQKTFARILGYVEQNDIHSPQVTVEESLLSSSSLRLPREVTKEQRQDFVEEVMRLVELDNLKKALVGLPGSGGLSTEQRKRLTIAVELVANPSIIFMDEPTSGLDARAAAIVMRTVRNTVDTGRTVVCTIHQPSIDIFEAFDEILLMKRGGRVIYGGKLGVQPKIMVDYFQGIDGVPPIPEKYNPATWMLEVTTPAVEERIGADFAELYAKSEQYREVEASIKRFSVPSPDSQPLKFASTFAQGSATQFRICLRKENLVYWRSPRYNTMRIVLTIIAALLFGSMFWDIGAKRGSTKSVFMVMGDLYCTCIFVGVNNASSVQPIVSIERTVFYREKAAGMYSALSYAAAQGIVEVPYIFVQTLIFGTITYFMIGFERTAAKFFLYLFMFLTFTYFTFYGMMAIGLTSSQHMAAVVSSAFYSLWNLLSGFLIPMPVDRFASETKTIAGHNLDPTPWHIFPTKNFNEQSRHGRACTITQCSYLTCMYSNSSTASSEKLPSRKSAQNAQNCTEFFRFIHRDLEPWARSGVTMQHLMEAKNFAAFRVKGKLYLDVYYACVQSRMMCMIWGLLQMIERYPGLVPDVDLMFDCMDRPKINRTEHSSFPLPIFRYCTTKDHFDIPFPDWSFWGWPKINIRPWNEEFPDIRRGSQKQSWPKRKPRAFWKGNPDVFSEVRTELLQCRKDDDEGKNDKGNENKGNERAEKDDDEENQNNKENAIDKRTLKKLVDYVESTEKAFPENIPSDVRSNFLVEYDFMIKNVQGKKRRIFEYAFAENQDDKRSEVFYSFNETIVDRVDIKSLGGDNHVTNNIIDAWSEILNFENQRRNPDSVNRFFFSTIPFLFLCTNKLFSEKENLDQRLPSFYTRIEDEMRYAGVESLEGFQLVFFPVIAFEHFYLLCVNMMKQQLELIDNRMLTEAFPYEMKYNPVILMECFAKFMKRNFPSSIDFDNFKKYTKNMSWKSNANHHDCGVFLMKHMETYQGENDVKWDCGLQKDNVIQLKNLRLQYFWRIMKTPINVETFNAVDEKSISWADEFQW